MVSKKIKIEETVFEKSLSFINSIFEHPEGKKGFSLYQDYRDLYVDIFSNQEKTNNLLQANLSSETIKELVFFDQSYIDNFTLCLEIKIKSPEIYNDSVKIIDTYIKPKKINEGSNYFYQESGAFFAFCLNHYMGISERLSLNIAAQLCGYSESRVDLRFRKLKKKIKNKIPIKHPDLISLILIFWGISRNKKISNILPFKNHTRSKSDLENAKNKYNQFVNDIINHHFPKIENFIKQNPKNNWYEIAIEYGLDLKEIRKKSNLHEPSMVLLFLICVFLIENTPNLIKEIKPKTQE